MPTAELLLSDPLMTASLSWLCPTLNPAFNTLESDQQLLLLPLDPCSMAACCVSGNDRGPSGNGTGNHLQLLPGPTWCMGSCPPTCSQPLPPLYGYPLPQIQPDWQHRPR